MTGEFPEQRMMAIIGKEHPFWIWNPYAGDYLYMEGKPTEEEQRQIVSRRRDRIMRWPGNAQRLELYETLTLFKGYRMLFQLWDNDMIMLYDEGPMPFKATITVVSLQPVEVDGFIIDQLFIHFDRYYLPQMEKENGYYNPILKHPAVAKDGQSFRMNAGNLYMMHPGVIDRTDRDIEIWRRA